MKLIQRAGNSIWMLEFYDGKRRRRVSTGERDKGAAEAVAQRILAGTEGRRAVQWTLRDALEDTYERIWSMQKSQGPALLRINKLIRAEGRTRLDVIDYNWLVNLRARMVDVRRCKPATVNRYMSAISKALNEAVPLGKLEARPRIPYAREPKGKLRWLTADEEALLLDRCGECWKEPDARAMRALIVFLLDTGARLSEALRAGADSMQRMAVAAGARQVTFTETKNGESRSVPLTERAAAALAEMPDWLGRLAVDRFTRLRDHVGLRDVSLHTMRHTCASRLVQGGMDLYRVMHWLGHSSINVTQRYAHLAPTSLAHGASILAQSGALDNQRAHSSRFSAQCANGESSASD